MIYVNFSEHITRKHGVLVEGWPLSEFKNPSAIGSQVELKVLLNAWNTGATRFRRMSTEEHIAWVESHANSKSPPAVSAGPPPVQSLSLPSQHGNPDPTLVTNPTITHMPFVHFESPAGPSSSAGLVPGMAKKPRKTRSDKGKSRKRATQMPGDDVTFSTSTL